MFRTSKESFIILTVLLFTQGVRKYKEIEIITIDAYCKKACGPEEVGTGKVTPWLVQNPPA